MIVGNFQHISIYLFSLSQPTALMQRKSFL
jgi:hypothetical protein